MNAPDRPTVSERVAADVDLLDRRLLAALQDGLPLVSRPFAEIGVRLGISEREVVTRLERLKRTGVVRRFGVVVRHHEIGYGANAMVVWDVPDADVEPLGRCLAGFDFITLCYRRPRRLPQWRYNLYCMIHGRSRDQVLTHLEWMIGRCGLAALPHAVLFSRRRFKQCGARYFPPGADVVAASAVRPVARPKASIPAPPPLTNEEADGRAGSPHRQ